jgi:hypothetical protein
MLSEEEALQHFLGRLSAEASAAIRTLEAAGTPWIEAAIHRVERALIDAACSIAERPHLADMSAR